MSTESESEKRLAEIDRRLKAGYHDTAVSWLEAREDVRYLRSLLQQPTSERCGECDGAISADWRFCGYCSAFIGAATGAGEETQREVLVRREDAARCAELVNDSIKAKGKFAAAILMMPPYPAPNCPICGYPVDNEGLCVLDAAHIAATPPAPSTAGMRWCLACGGPTTDPYCGECTERYRAMVAPAPSVAGEAHYCPRCGRRMKSEFDPDVGMWYECENCDYRESVSSAPTTVPVEAPQECLGCIASNAGVGRCLTHEPKLTTTTPSAREAAREIHDWIFSAPNSWPIRGEATITQLNAIISKYITPDAEIERLRNELTNTVAFYKSQIGYALEKAEMFEKCGYYCDPAVGHIDHPITNQLRHAVSQPEPHNAILEEVKSLNEQVKRLRAELSEARANAIREAVDAVKGAYNPSASHDRCDGIRDALAVLQSLVQQKEGRSK